MEAKLIEILNTQNFSLLEDYSLLHFEDINVNDIFFSIGNDGSILAVAPTEVLDQYR
jgi:hypothetical protein